jgi:uncharacterized membrane protein YgcG
MKTLTALLVFSAIATAPALAQTPAPSRTDGRWTPYLGCWRLLVENVRNQGIDELIQSAVQRATTPAMTVCVQPASASTGVTMTTFADGKKVLEQSVVADAAGHPVTDSGCTGTQTSDWSRDGFRLLTRVEMACNNRPKQTISGLTLFAKGPAWVDIQAMQSDGDQQVRIRRYVRTFDQPEGIAALPADLTARASMDAQNASARTLSQEDVTEASSKVASQAVEAAIVESESRFNLNSRALLQLADAGVSPNVIDLMVAQSFPSHFRVERPVSAPMPVVAALPPSIGYPGVYGGGYGYPYGAYDPWDYYGYYYSPFAYSYWGNGYYNNNNRYYISNGNSTVFVNGSNIGGGTALPTSQGRGQVVNGQGYTRVHTGSEPDAAAAVDPNSHTTSTRSVRSITDGSASTSTPTTSSSSPSTSSSSSSGDSGGNSNQGSSNSGGGDSGGRTAQPR